METLGLTSEPTKVTSRKAPRKAFYGEIGRRLIFYPNKLQHHQFISLSIIESAGVTLISPIIMDDARRLDDFDDDFE